MKRIYYGTFPDLGRPGAIMRVRRADGEERDCASAEEAIAFLRGERGKIVVQYDQSGGGWDAVSAPGHEPEWP